MRDESMAERAAMSQLFDDLRKPLTFEDYAALCRIDGEEPTRDGYESLLAEARANPGKLGHFGGMTFTKVTKQ